MDLVPSPCNQVCTLDPRTGFCRGCWRTGAEIGAWPTMPPDARRALLRRLAERRSDRRADRRADPGV